MLLFSNTSIDQVVFLIDKDPHNFSAKQYDEAVKYCNNEGYTLCVSNPAFELFLLMHDDRIFTVNLEKKVSDFFGHNKSNFDFSKYKDKVKVLLKTKKDFVKTLTN